MSQTDKQTLKPGYKQTVVGVIPEDWEVTQLKKIINLTSGKTKPSNISENCKDEFTIPVYGGNGILGYTNQGLYDFKTIVIGRVGEYCGVVRKIEGEYWITDNALFVKEFYLPIDISFLAYKLTHFDLSRLRNKGGQPLISQKPIYNQKIPLPPLPEQQKIAAILSCWDTAIEKCEAAISALEKRNKGLAQQLLRGPVERPTPSPSEEGKEPTPNPSKGGILRSTEPSPLPGGKKTQQSPLPGGDLGVGPAEGKHLRLKGFEGEWEEVRAKELFENHTDKSHDGSLEVLSSTQERGVIPRSEVGIDIKYDPKSLKNYKKVEKGNFIISLRSFQGGIEYSYYEGLVSPAYTVLKERKEIDHDFYRKYLKTESFINRLNSVIYGIRDGKQISFKDFSSLKLFYPPLDEQKAISSLLQQADQELALQKAKKESLQTQKEGLMQKLLTGEVRVNNI